MTALPASNVALVAGGTGGLGRSVCEALLMDGATVVTTYRSPAELTSLAQSASAAGNAARLSGRQVDVTDEAAARELVADILGAHGRIDCLINAVRGYAGGHKLWEVETAVLDRMLSLNLRSGFALARAAVPAMLQRRAGCIVNVVAQAALSHPAGAAAYAASKAAALAMFGSLASELVGSGVRVNTILPTIIDTEANRKAMPHADFSKWPKPADIARVILFLCSPQARAVHGAAIPVSGF